MRDPREEELDLNGLLLLELIGKIQSSFDHSRGTRQGRKRVSRQYQRPETPLNMSNKVILSVMNDGKGET